MVRILFAVLCTLGQACAVEPATPLTDRLLDVARAWGDRRFDHARSREQLRALAADVRSVVARAPDAPPSAGLNEVIFGARHFVREVDDRALRFVLLPEVLESRRGNCVGLGTLYLAVAELLGWNARGVMMPGHFFVRIEEQAATHNLELLRRGEWMPDAWYAERFPIPGGAAREYARALSIAEVAGIVEYDAGEELRRRGQLQEARRAYDRARTHFPGFAEAHASRGAISHLLGDLDQALADYQAAEREYPHLPGLTQNLTLLRTERSRVAQTSQ